MFPSRESGNINRNQSSCNYFSDFQNNCGLINNGFTNAYRVQSFGSFPISLMCRPRHNVAVIDSLNTYKYSNCVSNKAEVYSINNNKFKNYYSPEEFYNYHPENQAKMSGTNYRTSSYKTNPSRDVLKITLKKKRKRTMFTTEQIIALEEVFHRKPYINREERIMMTKKLQVNEKSIKVWFQNRRRLTDKRCKEYRSDSPSSEDMSESYLDRLSIVESNINQSTDENGYVRLDTSTMIELVNVIDEYLSQDPNSHVEETNQPVVSENKVIYEPISPVSLTGDSEEIDLVRNSKIISSEHFTEMKSLLFF